MKLWVGVTDYKWFAFQAERTPDELNFWQPSANTSFKALDPLDPFLFKLHSPYNKIAGGGFFVRYSQLPVSVAWEAFGEKNGTQDQAALRNAIARYRTIEGSGPDPLIGCIVLAHPFFWNQNDWIDAPADWKPNIVRGKGYDTATGIGKQLWEQVRSRLNYERSTPSDLVSEQRELYGAEYLTRARLGQGAFRVMVTDAYERQCAMTGERTLPVLEAAHIQPYASSGPHNVTNGLLLRSDLHKLFDLGYVTVNQELRVEVSSRIRSEYENGRAYYALHGQPLAVVPANSLDRPDNQYLEYHNTQVFRP